MVRDYVDHRSMSLHRMLGEATQDTPPFDEIQITSTSLLGDTDDEIQSRLTELRDNGVHVRIVGDSSAPPKLPENDLAARSHLRPRSPGAHTSIISKEDRD